MKRILFSLLCLTASVRAELRPNGVFADHMVLQRNAPVPVWGTASPGEKVQVRFAGQEKSAVADEIGRWKITLDPLVASGTGAEFVIEGSQKITLSDVLVGEVWLCSGQSNMASAMGSLKDKPEYASDLTSADFPLIRQGTVPREPSVEPVASRQIAWTVCSPATVENFTAAGFYFAREIQKELGVPVGLILAAWGGTSAESWTSKAALDTVPEFQQRANEQLNNLSQLPEQIAAFPARLAAWEEQNGRSEPAVSGDADTWMNPGGEGWSPGSIKAKWQQLGLPHGGIAWIRKEVTVPADRAGKGFRLDLGMVNEQLVTAFWNGKKLGEFGRKAPGFYKGYTHFDVPGNDVREGKNLLAFRFVTHLGDRPPLNRDWAGLGLKAFGVQSEGGEVRIEKAFPPLNAAALAARPKVPEGSASHTSSGLFGGMINPLIPFAIRGVLWYQGEQDGSRGLAYRQLLPLLITDWRSRWGQGDFPFLIQQLPNWKAGNGRDTNWAEVREAQWLTAEKLPNTGIAIATEIGESENVHPANKREIGRRLSLVALDEVYDKELVSCGPTLESAQLGADGKYRVKFHSSGALKTTNGAAPALFAVAGPDKKFVDATAILEGNELVISSPEVNAPAALRYAWINDTAQANLTDDSGLPTVPFRTDSWPIRGEK